MSNREYSVMNYNINGSDKEYCLLCSIIIIFHISYLGIILYIFQLNNWDN